MATVARELVCGTCGRPAIYVAVHPGTGVFRVESAPFLPEDVTRYYCGRHLPPGPVA